MCGVGVCASAYSNVLKNGDGRCYVATKSGNIAAMAEDARCRTGMRLGTDMTLLAYILCTELLKTDLHIRFEAILVSLRLSIYCVLSLDLCIVHRSF